MATETGKLRVTAWRIVGAFAGVWLLGTWLWNIGQSHRDGLPPETGPVVLAMQKIGQLHTTSFTMKDVVREETQVEPEGIIGNVPGVSNVVHWATRNQVLVVADGVVEAGVDLSALSAKDVTGTKDVTGKPVWRVHLPPVTIYPPNVKVRVEQNNPGWMWHDDNIVPKAQEKASQRLREAADKTGIRQQAQDNAIQTLHQMQQTMGRDVEFYF